MPRKRNPESDAGGNDDKKKKKSLDSKFGGMTEEEVMQRLLPDHLKADLDVIFIGINPGLYSAYTGHHYSNASNHFWPCLYESGMIPHKMSHKDDANCLNYGIGFTNIVPRTTRSSNDLTRKEIKEWSKVMLERMAQLKPLVLCFNGKGIYEIYDGKKCEVGIQGTLPGSDTVVYVMPSTSGRAASHPRRADKLKFFHELKSLISRLKLGKKHEDTHPVDSTSTQDGHPEDTPSLQDGHPEDNTSTQDGHPEDNTSLQECHPVDNPSLQDDPQ